MAATNNGFAFGSLPCLLPLRPLLVDRHQGRSGAARRSGRPPQSQNRRRRQPVRYPWMGRRPGLPRIRRNQR